MVAVAPGFGRCPMRRIRESLSKHAESFPGHTRDSWAQTGTRILQTNLTTIPTHSHTHDRTRPYRNRRGRLNSSTPTKMPVSVQKHRGEPVPVRVPVPARAESVAAAHGVLRCFSIYFQEALCMSRNCSSSSYYINNRQPNGSLSNEMNLNLNLNLNLRNCMYSEYCKLFKRK
jgi:hypothetical protein